RAPTALASHSNSNTPVYLPRGPSMVARLPNLGEAHVHASCIDSAVLVLVTFFAQAAHAFIDPPWISPANPLAGEAVSVNIRLGICDAFVGRDGFPQVSLEGNHIHVVEYGDHYEDGDEPCIFGVGTATHAIGAHPPGDYTLTVDMVYPHPVLGPTLLHIG